MNFFLYLFFISKIILYICIMKKLEKISAFFMGYVFNDAFITFNEHPRLSIITMFVLAGAMGVMILKQPEKDGVDK